MDSFGFQNNIKAEKAHAMFRYRRLKKITAMFRLIEICIFLIIISKFTSQLPVAFKISGEYFRGLSVSAISPRSVFIIGNAIVIVLFLKSGKLTAKDGELENGKLDLYDEYVKNCEKNRNVYVQEIKKQRKHSNFVSNNKKEIMVSGPEIACSFSKEKKKINRSHSENLKRRLQSHHEEAARGGGSGKQLRRSTTEKLATVSTYNAEDEMSNEDFRRTVEAFIARQQRFLREEGDFSSAFSFGT